MCITFHCTTVNHSDRPSAESKYFDPNLTYFVLFLSIVSVLSDFICPYLSLSVLICPYLPLSAIICPFCHYLPLYAFLCPYLPLSAFICPYLPSSALICPHQSVSTHSMSLILTHISFTSYAGSCLFQ